MKAEFTASISQDFIADIFKSLGVHKGLRRLFEFLITRIPAQRVMCCMINRHIKTMTIIVNYETEQSFINNSFFYLQNIFPFDELVNMLTDKKNYTTIVGDLSIEDKLAEHVKIYGEGYHSALNMCVYMEENDDILISVNFLAQKKDQFTKKHADILAVFRRPLQELLREVVLTPGELPIIMQRYDPVDAPAEKLLRRCGGMRQVMQKVDAVAATGTTVLIHGASGVGKELVAQAVHELSPRRSRPFIRINCGAIPDSLVDSEFFGYEKGAFTGATSSRAGIFERARGGTLYLDEIGELSPAAQVRLLRVMEDKESRRVGGGEPIPVDVRIVAATHRDLRAMARQHAFREDLWYRLSAFLVEVPDLARRVEDIPLLVEHFYSCYIKENTLDTPPRLTKNFIQEMMGRPWPGNIRQLRHAVEQAIIMSHADRLPELQLMLWEGEMDAPRRRGRPIEYSLSREQILDALEKCGQRIAGMNGAATLLGVNPGTLRHRMACLGVAAAKKKRR